MVGAWHRWHKDEEQLANAKAGLFPLTPVSDAAAEQTRDNWAAVLPGQEVPLIWEATSGNDEDDE